VFWPLPPIVESISARAYLAELKAKKTKYKAAIKGAANYQTTVSSKDRYEPVLCNAILFYAAYVLAKAARVLEMRQVVPMTPSLSHQCYSLPLFLFFLRILRNHA